MISECFLVGVGWSVGGVVYLLCWRDELCLQVQGRRGRKRDGFI